MTLSYSTSFRAPMRFAALGTILVGLTCISTGQSSPTTYLGIFFSGKRTGYISSRTEKTILDKKPAEINVSDTFNAAVMEGTAISMKSHSVSTVDAKGRLRSYSFTAVSNGRVQKITAVFGLKSAVIKSLQGKTTIKQVLPIPGDAGLIDDPLESTKRIPTSKGTDFYTFDSDTISFQKVHLKSLGERKVDIAGVQTRAQAVEIDQANLVFTAYLNKKQDLIKVEGPIGMAMWPITARAALASPSKAVTVDIAESSKITPVGNIADPTRAQFLSLSLEGTSDSMTLPSDEQQTSTKKGSRWLLDIHPKYANPTATIPDVEKTNSKWLQSDTYVPAESAQFRAIAKKILGPNTNVLEAERKIQLYVYNRMKPDYSIGILRDASEIWETGHGVCRDYAILTTTLSRAAGIPCRLVTGIVDWDTDFYYHAWVEYFDGSHWIGLDSTTDDRNFSATHVKLAEGTTTEAFNAPILRNPKIVILSQAKSDVDSVNP